MAWLGPSALRSFVKKSALLTEDRFLEQGV